MPMLFSERDVERNRMRNLARKNDRREAREEAQSMALQRARDLYADALMRHMEGQELEPGEASKRQADMIAAYANVENTYGLGSVSKMDREERKRARKLLKNALVFLNKPMNKCRIKLKLARP